MNYRHAFHAGNHADVLKHVVLLAILAHLKRKETPFAVLDTHAGRGLYDLRSDEARRSAEWREGVNRIWDWADPPALIGTFLEAVRALNPEGARRFYPGSPILIAEALRPRDRLAACEKHPEEAEALKQALRGRAQIHVRDGYEGLRALTPFPERRGLILIDPPYEAPDDLAQAVQAIKAVHARFAHAIYLLWRPLKDSVQLDAADAELPGPKLRADLAIAAPALSGPLTASSVLVINPPFGLDAALKEALPALSKRLAADASGGWKLRG